MLIAFILNVTLLPALITLCRPPAESQEIGYRFMKPVDHFLIHQRKILMPLFIVITCIGLFFASQIRFDFDPLNLKDPNSESVKTLFHIMEDPDATIYTVQILEPSLDAAQKLATQLDQLPEVDHTITLASFVPTDQDEKLALIEDAKFLLDPSLNPLEVKETPNDSAVYETLRTTSNSLKKLGEDKLEAAALAEALETVIAKNDPVLLARLNNVLIKGIQNYLEQLRLLLNDEPATIDDINDELRHDWITEDGRAKIEVYPKGNARDHKILAAFTEAVRTLAPQATGAPIAIQESGKTVMGSFIQAGLFALTAIFLLLLFVLRRIRDVFYTLIPLILAGILTLGTMKSLELPLNFANVIALPLLLSLGVSYAIYFVTYWKSGKKDPLSSGMARAVLFSAATTLVAFFSLSLSSHTGTCGMGQLLTISLLYCVACSFLVLPVLLNHQDTK
jgi:hopanoid biosynthesis associated RND transporter like protein HpnN